MTNTLKKMLYFGMIGLASLLPAKSDADVKASIDSNSSTRYMFFGLPFSEGNINQSMLNVNKGNFTGILWGNYDTRQKRINEIDVFADYTKSMKKAKVSLGAVYFKAIVGDKWADCIDWYASGCATNIPLSPSITCHKFTGAGKGFYVEGALSKDFPIRKEITAVASVKLGYNNKAFRERKSFSHLEANLKAPIPITKKFSVIPNINCSRALASDLDDIIWGGINLHYDF